MRPGPGNQSGAGKGALITVISLAALAAVLFLTSLELTGHSCEVCMEYRDRGRCRRVSAASIDEARQGAIINACAFIANGVTQTMACQQLRPVSENCR